MDMKDQKLATEIAEERMTLIAPLLSQNLDKDSVRLIRAEICERNQISQRTLERYLTSYLKGGFDALKPQSRSAECKYKIPQELLDEAIRLRRELPSRSVPTIIKILELEGKAEPGFLKRTTLQDALSRAGYSSAMMSLYNDKGYASQRFQRAHRHDLWQGDIKYGLILNLGGKTTQTYFSCLIDDATRYIPVSYTHLDVYKRQPLWENNVCEYAPGKLVMLMRAEYTGRLYRSFSDDDGQTWSPAQATDIPNPASKITLLKIEDKTVLIHNPTASTAFCDWRKRTPLSLWVSLDGTRTWSKKVDLCEMGESFFYPHGFWDPAARQIYLACENGQEHYLLKIPGEVL